MSFDQEATDAFNSIDPNVLHRILEISDPKGVVSLCQTNEKYRNVCNRPETFIKLMKAHYPQFDVTNNPRRQYTLLANEIGTWYNIGMIDIDRVVQIETGQWVYMHYEFDRYPIAEYSNSHGRINFKILGIQPPRGSNYVVFIRHDLHGLSEPVVYRNMDYAIDYFMEEEYGNYVEYLMDLSEIFVDYNPGIETAITNQDFINWLAVNEYPENLSPEDLREYISETKFLTYWTSQTDPELTREFYFIEIVL